MPKKNIKANGDESYLGNLGNNGTTSTTHETASTTLSIQVFKQNTFINVFNHKLYMFDRCLVMGTVGTGSIIGFTVKNTVTDKLKNVFAIQSD